MVREQSQLNPRNSNPRDLSSNARNGESEVKTIGAILTLLSVCLVADASNCRVVTVRQNYHAPAYQHHAAAVVVPYYAPSYSVGYNGSEELAGIVKALIEDNKAMRQDLIQAIKAGPGVAPGTLLPLKARPPGLEIMAAKCATCHDESTAKAKGGGHLLFRGGEFIDQGDNLSRAVEEMDSGRMPRGGKLSDAEKYAVLSSLVIRPEAAAAGKGK
jgi:hypothetical protein